MKRDPATVNRLPIAPVTQHATDDVELVVMFEDGHAELHRYRPGAVEWLVARYSASCDVSGQPWQVTLAQPNENGDTTCLTT